MSIKKIIAIGTVSGLIIIFAFSLGFFAEEDIFITIVQGEAEKIVDKEFIYSHSEAIVFPAVVRSSGKKPVETEYKGIELSTFFSSLGIDTSGAKRITFNATDGYRIILKVEELLEPNNVYLTFERDGELMKSKKHGGNGPFQLVIRRDPFSQRWIKHVEEIIIE